MSKIRPEQCVLNLGTEPCSHADTGGWLLAMKFAGYDLTNSQLQAAVAFLKQGWPSTTGASHGSFGQPYAMWAVYQGLAATIGSVIPLTLSTC